MINLNVEGGTTKDPSILYYRDALECFEFLFGNPLFRDYMEYVPRREFTTGEESERLYNDIMTADSMAWNLQVTLKWLVKQVRKKLMISHTVRNVSNPGEH